MKKLIKYLNQYEHEKYLKWDMKAKFWDEWWVKYHYLRVISKEYKFIEWLVENNKIDWDKLLIGFSLFRKYFYDIEYVKNYDRLIMFLSVDHSPLTFLDSILK